MNTICKAAEKKPAVKGKSIKSTAAKAFINKLCSIIYIAVSVFVLTMRRVGCDRINIIAIAALPTLEHLR